LQTSVVTSVAASSSAGAVACLVCGHRSAHVFFELDDVPALCNAPCPTREAALSFPMGQIKLAFCPQCGMLFNRAFQPEAMTYNQQYENSLHYSGTFDEYVRSLANDLVTRLGLYGKDIIEIGSGKGDFLALLCELGANRGVGFDPSYEPDRLDAPTATRLQFIRDLYTEAYSHLDCDLLCCRQTLEHIPSPADFLKSIRRALGEHRTDSVVFIEVPNALYTLRLKGIWDIIYEHVSYFWSAPLSRLFAESGFAVMAVRETYGNQFLCLEATPGDDGSSAPSGADQMDRVAEEVRLFGETFRSTVEKAGSVLENIQRRKQRAVVWGAGSKGVTFANIFKNHESVEVLVDINPHKQGKFVPGTGQPIVDPVFLSSYKPDVVFLMNPLYRQEIAKRLADLSVHADLVPV
jgi:SAM-dependent methyltransferase